MRNMLHSTMLRCVALKCCNHLAGALKFVVPLLNELNVN